MGTRAEGGTQEAYEDLRSALDASGIVGLWDWDLVRRTARYDRGAARLLALDPELAGKPLHGDAAMVGIHPDDRVWLRNEVQRAVAAGGHFLAEYRVTAPEWGTRWLLSRGRIYHDDVGRPIRSKGVIIDITDNRDESAGFFVRSPTHRQHPLDRAAALLLDAQKAVDEVEFEARSHLRMILDLALFEVGTHLAQRSRH